MNTSIKLDKMLFYSYHGVLEQERLVGNGFEVTLKVDYPFETALESDNLDDTLNYAELYDIVAEQMNIPSQLLEHVAGRILKNIRAKFPQITGGSITITKLAPPFKCQLQGVSVTVDF